MLRVNNTRSSRQAERNTNPDTSRLPKNEVKKQLSFDVTSIVPGKYFDTKLDQIY